MQEALVAAEALPDLMKRNEDQVQAALNVFSDPNACMRRARQRVG